MNKVTLPSSISKLKLQYTDGDTTQSASGIVYRRVNGKWVKA